jgi:hypothetical protein
VLGRHGWSVSRTAQNEQLQLATAAVGVTVALTPESFQWTSQTPEMSVKMPAAPATPSVTPPAIVKVCSSEEVDWQNDVVLPAPHLCELNDERSVDAW